MTSNDESVGESLRRRFIITHKYEPDFLRPRTFSEKVQHRKLFTRDPRFPRLADKVLVKHYVASLLGPEWVIPTLWSGVTLPPLRDRRWPHPFVLKANHGCRWNLFVDSDQPDWTAIEETATRWVNSRYGEDLGEWLYSEIPPQLLVEPNIAAAGPPPIDYKLFVFNGKAHYIAVYTRRGQGLKCTFFDAEWQRQEFCLNRASDPNEIAKPHALTRMIDAAETLGRGFSFVRVDCYEVGHTPLFGEMTFYPNSGLAAFEPSSIDLVFGGLWPGTE